MGSDSILGVKAAKTLDKLIAWTSGIFLGVGLLMYTPLIREGGLAGYNEAPRIGEVKADKASVATGETPVRTPIAKAAARNTTCPINRIPPVVRASFMPAIPICAAAGSAACGAGPRPCRGHDA